MRKSFALLCLAAVVPAAAIPRETAMAQSQPPRLGKSSVKEVVAAMTLEEKAKLLVGMGMALDIPGIPAMDPEDRKVPEKVPGAAGRTHAIARLGIPSITLADGPAGVRIDPKRKGDESRTYHATAETAELLPAAAIEIVAAPGEEREVREIARVVLRHVEAGGRLDEIGVLRRQPAAYLPAIRDGRVKALADGAREGGLEF